MLLCRLLPTLKSLSVRLVYANLPCCCHFPLVPCLLAQQALGGELLLLIIGAWLSNVLCLICRAILRGRWETPPSSLMPEVWGNFITSLLLQSLPCLKALQLWICSKYRLFRQPKFWTRACRNQSNCKIYSLQLYSIRQLPTAWRAHYMIPWSANLAAFQSKGSLAIMWGNCTSHILSVRFLREKARALRKGSGQGTKRNLPIIRNLGVLHSSIAYEHRGFALPQFKCSFPFFWDYLKLS